MKIFVRRFSLILTIQLILIETIHSTTTDTNSTEIRKGRVNGRIVKLYSGAKPDPILCLEEGFKPDPVDCSVFYRCTKASREKFTLYRFQCGPGTVYDPETEICNHPSNTKRSECGGLVLPVIREDENEIETQELPSPINTTSSTYTTQAESTNITTSTTTTKVIEQYNDYKPISTAFYPSIVTTESQYPGSSDNLQNYQWTHSQNETQYLVTHLPTVASSPDITSPCIRDGFIGDSENCRKFYRCVSNSRGGFIKYEFLCSESTVWDDNIQSCNHAWAARNKRCGRNDDDNKNNVLNEESFNTLLQNNEVQNSYGAKIEIKQNKDNNDLYENNLPYGIKLNNNKNIQHKQTEYITTTSVYQETINNKLQNKLNHMYEVTEIKHHNNDINEINYFHATSSPYVSKNLEQNYTTKKNNSDQSTKCSESGFMADAVDCKKFYRCVDNGKGGFTKYEFSCSQETVWDSKIEACNHPWAVKECGGILLAENPVTEAITSIPIITSTFKETDDNGYINLINEEHEQTTSSTILTTVSLISTTDIHKLTSTECASSGFFGYQNDCQKFYRCVDNEKGSFTKYDYLCGEGTLWDQNLKACNHAWAVKSCNQSTMMSNTTPAGNSYDASSSIQTTTSIDTSDSDIDSGYVYQSNMTTLNPPIDDLKTTMKYPQSQQNDCESSGFMGDTNDCKKFYRCVDNGNGGFTRHEFSCGENTVWDPEIEACNHAWAVKQCGKTNNGDEKNTPQGNDENISDGYVTPAYNIDSSSQTTGVSSETPTKPTLVSSDYNQCQSNGFIGDKLDCKKFYRCVESGDGKYIRYEFTCGDGTVWDPKIQACNHAWAVEECGNNMQEQNTHDKNDGSVTPSTSSSNEDGSIYTTQSTTKIDNLISSTTSGSSTIMSTINNREQDCQSTGFMGDSIDCKKFYRCVDDGNGGFIKHEFSCGQGTVWDSKIEACNHEWAVEHCGKHSEHQQGETTSSINQNEIQETTSPSNSITQIQLSTTTAIYTSTTLSNVDNHTSSPISEDKDICTSQGYFGNTKDCKKFYRCVNDGKGGFIKYDFSCGDGSVWVQEMQSCDHDSNETTCSYATNTEKYNETNSSSMSDEQITESESSISTTKATTSISTTESIRPVHENECIEDGYFGNTEDCRKFYRCVSNEKGLYTKYDYICGEGTIWDSDITACNHPRDVTKPSCKSNKETATTVSSSEHTNDGNVNLPESTTISTVSTTNKNEENSSSTTASTASTTNKNEPSSTSSNNEGTVGNSNKSNITCTKAGFYANPNDCKKFYRCVDWDNNGEKYSVFHFECGEGTIWDPSLETCNYEESIYPPRICNGTLQQNENITESSSTTEEISTTTISDQNSTTESDSTTQQTTTQKTSTQQTTTQQTTATQPTTTQQTTTQPTTTEKTTTQQTTTQPTTTEQTTTLQTTTQLTTTEQTTTQQTTTQQTTTQQTTTQQTTTEQTTTQPTTTEQTTTQQTTTQPTTTEQTTTQQTTTQQTTKETTAQQTTTEQQSTTEQVSTTPGESTTQLSSTETTTTPASTTQTTESDQTATQEQTTKSSTEPTTSSEIATTESTTQISSTDQVTSSTQPQTTEENISQTESQSSTTEASTTETEHQSSTEANTSDQDCPDTDEDQILLVCPTSFKRHPKYCNIFYQCTEDSESHEVKVATFNCPNNTIYDESKVQCVEEDKSEKKCTGEMAKKHRVKRLGIADYEQIVVTKESMACPGIGHFPFEKHEECSSILLKCELTKSGKLRGYIYKCPEGFVYWSISRRCESLKTLKDCKKSFDGLNKRYDIPEEKYNVAH